MTDTIMQHMDVQDIPMNEIDADSDFNCRGDITPLDVSSLAQDIEARGLIAPGVVMLHPDPTRGYKYKLIAGYRRHLAFKMLKKENYPCSIRAGMSMEDAMFFNLNENIQRKELSIMQEATAVHRIKLANPRIGRPGVAERLGKSEGWVQMREMLLNLPEEVQLEVNAGIIKQAQIRDLHRVMKAEGKTRCFEVAKQIKTAKERGSKATRIKAVPDREKKKERKRNEIFEMMNNINLHLPHNLPDGTPLLWGKALAWAAGEVSDNELFERCSVVAQHNNLTWEKPIDPEVAQVVEVSVELDKVVL